MREKRYYCNVPLKCYIPTNTQEVSNLISSQRKIIYIAWVDNKSFERQPELIYFYDERGFLKINLLQEY